MTSITKILIAAVIMSAIIIPASALALEEKEYGAQAEVAKITPHVKELFSARSELEKVRQQEAISDSEIASKESRMNELQDIIDKKTSLLKAMEEENIKRFTLEPSLKTKLEAARSYAKTLDDLPINKVSISHSQKSLIIGIDESQLTTEKNEQYYKDLLQKEFSNIPMKVVFSISVDEACTTQTSDCDPIVGGIEMNENGVGDCTIGLPLYRSGVEGYITAGHCVGNESGTGDDVYQPAGGSKIGDTSVRVYTASCDCAFIAHTGSEDTQTKIWYSSNTYVTITGYTDRVANGSYVLMTGSTSGPEAGIVDDNTSIFTINGIDFDVVDLTTDITEGGDSGAPYTSLAASNFYGTHKGVHGGVSAFIPWENIEAQLGL